MRKTIVALMLVAFVAFALVPAFAGAKAPACPKKAATKTVVTKTITRVGTAPAKTVMTTRKCAPVKKAATVKSTKVICRTAKKVMPAKTTASTMKKPAAKPGLK